LDALSTFAFTFHRAKSRLGGWFFSRRPDTGMLGFLLLLPLVALRRYWPGVGLLKWQNRLELTVVRSGQI
jgi:hypothetical protein